MSLTATQGTTVSSKRNVFQATVMHIYPWHCYQLLPSGESAQVTVALLVLWLYQNNIIYGSVNIENTVNMAITQTVWHYRKLMVTMMPVQLA